jgi:hypothetical protein
MQVAILFVEVIILLSIIIIYLYAPAYIRKKGENLATKEDIAEITDKVEGVKHQYELIREQFKSRSQLRLAAIDQRLETHQKAYSLWRKLLSRVHDKEMIGEIVYECQQWWSENCLYLEPEPRRAFKVALDAASIHNELKEDKNVTLIERNWSVITQAGEAIVKAVKLPPIGDLESEDILSKRRVGTVHHSS